MRRSQKNAFRLQKTGSTEQPTNYRAVNA